MKPLRLEIEGLLCFKNMQEVAFPVENGLFAVIGKEDGALSLLQSLTIALFGKADAEPVGADKLFDKKGKATTLLVFEEDGKEYEIKRIFKSNPDKNKVEQSATLQENVGKKKEFLARSASSADKKIFEILGLDPIEFEKRLFLNKDTATTLFSSEIGEKIKFVSEFFGVVENSIDFNNNLFAEIEDLRISAQSLADRMELIVPKEGESLEELKGEEEKLIAKNEEIKTSYDEISVLVNDGKYAEICKEKLEKIENELAALESEKEARLDAKGMVDRSENAEMLSAVIAERDVLIEDQSKAAIDTEEFNKLFAEAQADLVYYQEEIKRREDEFKSNNIKTEEYKAELFKLILKSASGAKPIDISDYVEKFYKKDDEELIKLIEEKKLIDEEFQNALAACKYMEEKINEFSFSSDFTARVSEASKLEAEIEGLKQKYNIYAEEYNLKSALRDEKAELVEAKQKELEEMKHVSESLLETILQGKYKTLEEAAENEIAEREDLYADYIEIEDLKIEISKFEERIFEINKQKEDLIEDLKSVQRKRADLEDDLNRRYPEYEEKEKEKNDLLAQYTVSKKMSGLEFGDECPFCKSLIMEKVGHEEIDVDRFDASLNAIKGYLDELNANIDLAIAEETSINSALLSCDQFIEMLEDEKRIRDEEIGEICARAGVTPETVKDALQQQMDKTRSIGAIMDQNVEFSVKISVLDEYIVNLHEEIADLDENILPSLYEKGDAINTEIQEKAEKYNELSEDFGEKTALELLPEILTVMKQKESIALEYKEKAAIYEEALEKKTNNDKLILLYGLRGNKVILKENEYSYQEIVVIAINEFYKEIVNRIVKLEKATAKLQDKLTESHKNLQVTNERISMLTQNLLALEALDIAISNQLKKIDEDFGAKFEAIGASNTADLQLAVLDEATKQGYLNFIDKNLHDIIFLEAEQTKLINEIELNRMAYDELAVNIQKQEALRMELLDTNKRLGALAVEIAKAEENAKLLNELSAKFNETIVELDKTEAYAASEEKSWYSDIDAACYLALISEYAGNALKKMTADRYSFDSELTFVETSGKSTDIEKSEGITLDCIKLSVAIGLKEAYQERFNNKVDCFAFDFNETENADKTAENLTGLQGEYNLMVLSENENLKEYLKSGILLNQNEKKKSIEIEGIYATE